jgi:hypothetical protein
MKKRLFNLFLQIYVTIYCSAIWADLPTPPDSDIASGSKDWIDVGGSLVNKVLSISCIALGAALLAGVAAGILKSYHVAHDKQDLGHFFKMLVVGLLVAAIGIGLVYAGYQVVGTD